MTNSGPWTPPGAPPQAVERFRILDIVLLLVLLVAMALAALGLLVVVIDGDPEAWIAVGGGAMTVITAALGRVMIQMARTLDLMAADVRGLRIQGDTRPAA